MPLLVTGYLLLAAIFAVGGLLLWQIHAGRGSSSAAPEWLRQFTLARYQVLPGLLSEGDYQFLRRQRGYRPALERHLRRDRQRIARLYLADLRVDFGQLQQIAREIAATSTQDESELLYSILLQRIRFEKRWWSIRCALACGFSGAQVARPLLDDLRAMHQAVLRSAAI